MIDMIESTWEPNLWHILYQEDPDTRKKRKLEKKKKKPKNHKSSVVFNQINTSYSTHILLQYDDPPRKTGFQFAVIIKKKKPVDFSSRLVYKYLTTTTGVLSVTVIIIGKGTGNQSSNPGWGHLYFSSN